MKLAKLAEARPKLAGEAGTYPIRSSPPDTPLGVPASFEKMGSTWTQIHSKITEK